MSVSGLRKVWFAGMVGLDLDLDYGEGRGFRKEGTRREQTEDAVFGWGRNRDVAYLQIGSCFGRHFMVSRRASV